MRDDVHGRNGNQEKASKEFGPCPLSDCRFRASCQSFTASAVRRFSCSCPCCYGCSSSSLTSPETYAVVKAVSRSLPLVKFILLGLIWLYMHHFCAGIRYLLLDLHKGVELEAARRSSWIVFVVSIAHDPDRRSEGTAMINRIVVGAGYGLKDWIIQRATASRHGGLHPHLLVVVGARRPIPTKPGVASLPTASCSS
jgi:succinate dehydrogenase cytochrome b556 subunit